MKKIVIEKPEKDWIDYSSLNLFMKCPRSYYWRCEQNITSSTDSSALINGKVYHDTISTFHNHLLSGVDFNIAKSVALESVLNSELGTIKDNSKHNTTVAISTLNNYFDTWKNEEYTTVHVEIGVAADLGDFIYLGKIDRVVNSPFGLMIMETKTTSVVGNRWLMRGKPNLQIDGYIGAYYINTGEMPAGGILDIIPINEKSLKQPFRVLTMRTRKDIENWLHNIKHWFRIIMECKSNNHFPMNPENCIPIIGANCIYYTLCNLYPHIDTSTYDIPDEYKVEKWMPWEIPN